MNSGAADSPSWSSEGEQQFAIELPGRDWQIGEVGDSMFLQLRIISILFFIAVTSVAAIGSATSLAAPIGGAPVPLPEGQVLCVAPSSGWQADSTKSRVLPPTTPSSLGQTTYIRIAPTAAACSASKEDIGLIAYGPTPKLDPQTVELWVDEGRVELSGVNLDGSRLEWEHKGEHGSDVCVAPTGTTSRQNCTYSVPKGLPAIGANATFRLYPAAVPTRALIFDLQGHEVSREVTALNFARVIVSSVLADEGHVDLAAGESYLSILHPDAIATAECDPGRCDIVDQRIRIRAVGNSARSTTLKLRLLPHVFIRTGESFSATATVPLDITYCPLTVVSPRPLRDTDDVKLVVRADARCKADSDGIHWTSNGNPISVLDTETRDTDVYILLALGRVHSERLTISALRGVSNPATIGVTSVSTAPPPELRAALHLDGFGEIDFVPTNRPATISALAPNIRGRIVPLPVAGGYSLIADSSRAQIQGDTHGGYVVLRFALRDDSLPGRLAQADLAHFAEQVQRAVREVNVASPIGALNTKAPIAEVLCTDKKGQAHRVIPGVPLHIPFAQRDGCRLLIHRERIPIEDGAQRLNVTVEVTSVAGLSRPDGHLTQRLLLRHGTAPRIIWLRGVRSQFDRISVELSHVTDESQYAQNGKEQIDVPAGHWTIVAEDTRFRLYATAAFPVQLYRFSNDPGGSGNGPLALNMGLISRFTWVTRDGTEGLFGLEGGVVGMGLSANNTRQLNVVGGLGLAVPLGNAGQSTQASINIHAWVGYRLGNEFAARLDGSGTPIPGKLVALNNWSFIFGPSVSFGNLGFDI